MGGSSNFEDDGRIEGGDIQHGMLTSPASKNSLHTFFPHPNKPGDIHGWILQTFVPLAKHCAPMKRG